MSQPVQPNKPGTPPAAQSAASEAMESAQGSVNATTQSVSKASAAIEAYNAGDGNIVDAALAIKGAVDAVKGVTGKISESLMLPVMKKLAVLKGQAILPAGKQMDPVMGIDVHMVTIPPSPAPVPMPHPYIGMLFNPKDWVSCLINTFKKDMLDALPEPEEGGKGVANSLAKNKAAVASIVMGLAGLSASVKFGGFVPRAITGTAVKNIPHIPMGAGFHPAFVAAVAKNHGKAFLGSLFVAADGDPMVGSFHLNYDCWDIGIVDLFKGQRNAGKKNPEPGSPQAQLYVPSGTILPIPWGRPVLVNSIPTPINPMAILDKLFKAALGKLLKAARGGMQKLIDKAAGSKAGQKAGCKVWSAVSKAVGTGQSHPVDVSGGYFYTDNEDFSLPGPIPLSFERTWYSFSDYTGPLGYGWHHSYDMALSFDREANIAVIRLQDGRPAAFEIPETGNPFYNRSEKMFLHKHPEGYYYAADNKGLIYRFTENEINNPHSHTQTHLLQSIANRNGFAIRFTYENALLVKIVDSAGRVLKVENDRKGRITAIHAPHPDVPGSSFTITRYAYTEEGDMQLQADALEQPMFFEYNNHLMVKEVWRNGLTWQFRYNKTKGADAKCVEVWGDNNLLHYQFDYSDPNTTIVINSLGHKKIFQHKNGVVTKYIDPNGAAWRYRYNVFNEMEWEIDPLENMTGYTYDKWGNQSTIIKPDGLFSQMEYLNPDFPWLITNAVDELGGKWTWKYDDAGNMIRKEDPLKAVTIFMYRDGLFAAMKDHLGGVIKVSFDKWYNLSKVENSKGAVTSFKYDLLGQRNNIINPNNLEQRKYFDLKGRLIQVKDFDGNKIELEYDRLDNIIRYQDNLKEIKYGYQGMWKLSARTEAGSTVRFIYDSEEQLKSIVNEEGLAYHFELDPAGNTIKETGFDGIVNTYQRNIAGQVIKIIRPDNRFTAFSYDEAGRVLEMNYHDHASKKFTYLRGLLSTATTGDITVSFKRDIRGNVLSETQGNFSATSIYDILQRRTNLKSSLGADIDFGLDETDKLVSISANGWSAYMDYDKLGLETNRRLPGNVESIKKRDGLGRLVTHSVEKPSGSNPQVELFKNYEWGINYQLKQVFDNHSGVTKFEYDKAGSLSRTFFNDGVEQYRNPGPSGNLYESSNRKDRKYNAGGRLIEDKSNVYEYDKEGFLVEKRERNGNLWKYSWNGAGMLVKVTRPDKSEVFFKYDALGRRIEKRFKQTITKWAWDGHKALHEWKEFDTRESSVDDIITWIFEEDDLTPAAKIRGNKKFSIITDHLGVPIQGYDENGIMIWNRMLDSYGKIKMLKGDEGFCNYLYPGQMLDTETGLAYNRFRYYAPGEGLYISKDPIGMNSGQLNAYAYVKDPNTWVDFLGLVGGGSYYQVRSTNTGGEVHHMPANSVNGLSHSSGPSIHMSTADHAQTGSHGSQGLDGKEYRQQQADHIANGRFDKAMRMDIDDIKGKFGSKYNNSMIEAVKRARDKNLITEQQAKNLIRACKK